MKMVRLLIQVPEPIKAQLDALRQEGTTASGFIRHLLETISNRLPSEPERTVSDGASRAKRSRACSVSRTRRERLVWYVRLYHEGRETTVREFS